MNDTNILPFGHLLVLPVLFFVYLLYFLPWKLIDMDSINKAVPFPSAAGWIQWVRANDLDLKEGREQDQSILNSSFWPVTNFVPNT